MTSTVTSTKAHAPNYTNSLDDGHVIDEAFMDVSDTDIIYSESSSDDDDHDDEEIGPITELRGEGGRVEPVAGGGVTEHAHSTANRKLVNALLQLQMLDARRASLVSIKS